MIRCSLVILAVALGTATPAGAQAPAAGGGDPISTAIKGGWESARRNIQQSGEVMPEENFAFKPVDTVRSFGEILAHVAGANYEFCAAARGEKSPHAEADFEKTAKTKADIVKALDESLKYCDAAYNSLTDARAAENVTMPFGIGTAPRAQALISNTGHLQEHYGNLVTYFRIKGIVPPSSRR